MTFYNLFFSIILGFGFFLYIFYSIIPPFLIGFCLAYFMNNLAHRLTFFSLNVARFAIYLMFWLVLVFFVYTIGSLFIYQLQALVLVLPLYGPKVLDYHPLVKQIWDFLIENFFQDFDWAENLSGQKTLFLNLLSWSLFSPITNIYFLKDWDAITKLNFLSDKVRIPLLKIIRVYKISLAALGKGIFLLCLTMAIIYSLSLYLFGLKDWLFLGVISGISSFFPYIGPLFALVMAGVFSLNQSNYFIQVLVFYFLAQLFESHFLYPKLIAPALGVHPLLILFALFISLNLFGVVGILFFFPTLAIVKIMLKFWWYDDKNQEIL